MSSQIRIGPEAAASKLQPTPELKTRNAVAARESSKGKGFEANANESQKATLRKEQKQVVNSDQNNHGGGRSRMVLDSPACEHAHR